MKGLYILQKLIVTVILGLGFIAWTSSAQAAIHIESWTTTHGAKVMYVHAPQLPMVDIELRFDAGSARDGKSPGLAYLTSDLLGTATQKMDENTLSSTLNNLGAQFSTDANRDSASLSLRSLTRPEILKNALTVLADVVAHPVFSESILTRERDRLLIGLKQKSVQPSALLSDAVWHSLYGQHPYGHPVEGTLQSVPTITTKMIEDFYQQYYVAHNAQVSIVGNVSVKQAKQIAEQLTQNLAEGSKPQALVNPKELQKPATEKISFKSSQTYYTLAQLGIQRGEKDYAALFVGNQILGGSGFSSLLMKNVREKRGLVYSVYSYFAPMKVAGPFMIGLSTKNATAKEADTVVRETLNHFMKGFSNQKLQAIKDNLVGGFPLRMDSNGKILAYISMIGFYHLPLDYLESFPKAIQAVTKQDILSAWNHHIHPHKMLMVMVGQPAS